MVQLQAIFFPSNLREKYRLDAALGALAQGNLPTREYIQLIREKSTELSLIGMPIAIDRILCMLLATLNYSILQYFVYNLSFTTDECLRSILRYDKSGTKDTTAIQVGIQPPTALMVEQEDNSSRKPHKKSIIDSCLYFK